MAEFLTELDIEVLEDGFYKLTRPLGYRSDILGKDLIVPAGRETDFASVPRLPIVYEAFGNRAHRESVVHDELYKFGIVDRAVADSVFLEAMKARGKPLWVRWGMYMGVRMGGWVAWNNYRKTDPKKV